MIGIKVLHAAEMLLNAQILVFRKILKFFSGVTPTTSVQEGNRCKSFFCNYNALKCKIFLAGRVTTPDPLAGGAVPPVRPTLPFVLCGAQAPHVIDFGPKIGAK